MYIELYHYFLLTQIGKSSVVCDPALFGIDIYRISQEWKTVICEWNAEQRPLWCHHLNVMGEFASFRDPESYAGGTVATGRVSQAGQVKG